MQLKKKKGSVARKQIQKNWTMDDIVGELKFCLVCRNKYFSDVCRCCSPLLEDLEKCDINVGDESSESSNEFEPKEKQECTDPVLCESNNNDSLTEQIGDSDNDNESFPRLENVKFATYIQ